MQTVTLYTKPTCPYCNGAKDLLDELQVEYTDIDVIEHPEKRTELSQTYNYHTVPMIFIGDEFIGGFSEMRALHEKGKLMQKIDA